MPVYPFRRTCKETAALLVAQEDRTLGLADRVGIRLHLGICKGCVNFEGQMLAMRSALKRWRGYQEPESADLGPK
jgi:hypothetical protein